MSMNPGDITRIHDRPRVFILFPISTLRWSILQITHHIRPGTLEPLPYCSPIPYNVNFLVSRGKFCILEDFPKGYYYLAGP